jgi:hypothetical protein
VKKNQRWLFAASLAACGAALLLCSCAPEERTIPVGQRIHHDDFEYSVTSCRVSKTIGEGKEKVTAGGNFYVVAFLVENKAKRVNHEWVDSIAYIVDAKGTVYENLPWAQKALQPVTRLSLGEAHITLPGGSDSTVLVFDLPEDVSAPALMVRGETLMGDFFDGGQFRKVRIALW